MKLLITGSQGQLGKEIQREGEKRGYQVYPFSHKELDITDISAVETAVQELKPDIIVNCAAYNQVDQAEKEREIAWKVNVGGVENLALSSRKYGVFLVHYSSDYVFSGNQRHPYREEDLPSPLNYYGKTKWEGEKVLEKILPPSQFLLLRVSWVFGNNPKVSFPLKLFQWSRERQTLQIVDDQISSPTYARDAAYFTLELLEKGAQGLFHLANSGYCSRCQWAKFILEKLNWRGQLLPAKTTDFPTPAQRPPFSALDSRKVETILKRKIPSWEEATGRFISLLKEGKNE
ncbi:MAG: dTDP-4-dehydrorhamnose reductase [Candidatus Atribacteria bacterium]|nr:dTDP-4-dehydrorhamnose reductase [Candidatus Atribacteria bacterium]